MSEREPYHHGDLRQALIAAALELISEKNVEGVSLREVARRVGVSHAAPYRHFADKESLLAAVAKDGFQMLHHKLEEAIQNSSADPVQQIQDSGVAYITFALEHPSHYDLMFGAYRSYSAQQNPELEYAARLVFMVLVGAIARGQQAGVIRADDSEQLALTAWALVHGWAKLWMDGQIPFCATQSTHHLAVFVTQILVEGLAKTET
ncbi:TetR/AcrR family transcriptional regulator [Nostoc sp. 'Peltigera membranacea cyanobiont' 232]|uniref:TetR/AcrR family transcriptional regulator n=1 Tax=Nostoc sp. 'Peltigera membranacea cyanobiont' 232 TaxID=2014531 RepID=UPI000B95C0EF|nr:TetR/AcrR family transcriptional regulator [Nostoc sp. 'Peltigera membranacea cyanobiont' 232]OYE02813.1 TetR family transcriptional regulator [Nostoc sp. 'Peltigera membranacea cyanobiont' 232]